MTTSLALQCDGANLVPTCAASSAHLGLTVDEVAGGLDWSATKISRIETGFVSVASTRAEICAYDMSPTKVKLIELDRERYEQT